MRSPGFECTCQTNCFSPLLEKVDIVVDIVVKASYSTGKKTWKQKRLDGPTIDFLGIGYGNVTRKCERTILSIYEPKLGEIPKKYYGLLLQYT